MLIKICLTCAFHQAKTEGSKEISYCSRENCYSEFSKCLSKRALKRFLEQEAVNQGSKKPAIV
jgi:hypothetical protein